MVIIYGVALQYKVRTACIKWKLGTIIDKT